VRICTEGRLAAAAGRVWIAQQGAVRIGRQSMRPVPCGVVAVDPATGDARVWEEDDGLASGFGRDVVGDARSSGSTGIRERLESSRVCPRTST